MSRPRLVSVIVPAGADDRALATQLDALRAQDYTGEWELVVQRDPVGRGPGPTRNAGAAGARGDLLAFCDADDLVAPSWLRELVVAAREADLVAGWLDVRTLNSAEVEFWHESPPWESRRPLHGFMPSVSTANCAIWADVFEALGGFDESQPGAEDRDLAWRAQLAGYRVERAPGAVVAYRYRTSLGALARQHYAWGRANPGLFRRFRRAGMARSRLRDALWGWAWVVATLPLVAASTRWRGRWVLRAAERAGHLAGSARHRVVFL